MNFQYGSTLSISTADLKWRTVNCTSVSFNYKVIGRRTTKTCVCVCVCISFPRKGFSWLKQNSKCNARDQVSDVVLRKLPCVKYLRRHVIGNHSRDLQASNCARVSFEQGRATISKRSEKMCHAWCILDGKAESCIYESTFWNDFQNINIKLI